MTGWGVAAIVVAIVFHGACVTVGCGVVGKSLDDLVAEIKKGRT